MKKYIKILTKDNNRFEGFLVNETKDFIIIKLKNGYNIGIKTEDIVNIEKIEEKEEEEIKFKNVYSEKNKKNISIIATGGTILSKIDYTTGGVHMLTKPEELLSVFPELFDFVNIKNIEIPFSIASEDMTPKEWIKIAKISEKLLNDDNEGIIIMHGTDTMHYTSSILSFMLRNLNKPVALTGAQRSSDRPSSDAFFNLLASSVYSLSDIAEVAIVMHGNISDDIYYANRGTRVRKLHTERRDAFQPVNDFPLAKIYRKDNKFEIEIINKNYKKRNNNSQVYADTNIEEKVALIKAYPGSDPEIIDYYTNKGYKGIVIEGTGFGHVPTNTLDNNKSWISHIKNAIENNVIFVMTSQTIFGRTNPFVYSNARRLYDLGVIYVEDMLTEVAYTKLMWVLGHTQNYEEVKKLMLTNIANEISDRSLYEYFNYN